VSHQVGGQAVIEGVMMRAPRALAVAVRRPSGEIAVLTRPLAPLSDRFPAFKLPILRGFVVLVSSLVLGVGALNYSAQQALPDEEEMGSWGMALAMAGAFALAMLLFLLFPLWLTGFLAGHFPSLAGRWAFNLVDGALRLLVFLLYLVAISRSREVRRIFEYHGAEHKAIYAYEAREPLTVEATRARSPLHPRCGTAFLLIVILFSVVVFAQVPDSWPLWAKGAARVVLLPLIAGMSYELIKLGDRFRGLIFFRLILWPGLALQRLTTREPDDAQIEVALRALAEALALDKLSLDKLGTAGTAALDRQPGARGNGKEGAADGHAREEGR
jgi:uncharacterized protein YqhQ